MNDTWLKDKSLALFFTRGVSLRTWHDVGMLDREVALYNELSRYLKHIYFLTYGGKEELEFKRYLADNISIIPRKYVRTNLLYSIFLPLIHRKVLRQAHFLKTNQMWGAWSAVLAKLLYRKKLVVRAGYLLSHHYRRDHPGSKKNYVISGLERMTYKLADAIITTSRANYEYIEQRYRPRGRHILVPNYVQTGVFRPADNGKQQGSICFVGRLTPQKNLLALLDALEGLPCSLTIIGSGKQEAELRALAEKNRVSVHFVGNLPNRELPAALGRHELFVLPSLWEGMPKVLLEAMSCGLAVIGSKINGTEEVIVDGENGLLCGTDPASIRKAVLRVINDAQLRNRLGAGARKTITGRYSLESALEKELGLLQELV